MATPLHESPLLLSSTSHTHLALAAAPLITGRTPGVTYRGVLPAQLRLTDRLTAERPGSRVPLLPVVVVCVPRRSGKTTTILAVAFGRCAAWPSYQVTYVAQTGIKSRERFYELLKALRENARGATGWRSRESRGEERIEFSNGSVLRFMPPQPDSFRSDAADMVIIDEAQEQQADEGAELLAGALPTLDTRPLAQVVIAGTAGQDRSRLLWEALERGRRGEWGIVEYAATEDDDPTDEALWWRVHPGLADGLTTIERMRERRVELVDRFDREYLGIWPATVTVSAFSDELWDAAGAEHTDRPDRFALAFDVAPGGERASVAAAWRDPSGRARVELLHTAAGSAWIPAAIMRLTGGRRGWLVGYDAAGGGTLDAADKLARTRNHPRLEGLSTAGYVTACSAFAADVIGDRLRHPRQPDLTAAVRVAARRRIGDAGWGWGRRLSDKDITPLVAATVALRAWDLRPPASKPRIRVAS